MLLIIDGDAISYIASKETIEESLACTDSLVLNICNYLKDDSYYMFLSFKPYFRNEIYPEYKAQRITNPTKLKYIKEIKEYLINKYDAKVFPPFEADDIVAYTKKQYPYAIVCSTDKDVLNTIPGSWFNYKKFQRGYTTNEYAINFLYQQTLMGDVADNIPGLKGIGEKKAFKLLEGLTDRDRLIEATLNAFKSHYKDDKVAIKQFELMYSLVKLLDCDEEYMIYGEVPNIGSPTFLNK